MVCTIFKLNNLRDCFGLFYSQYWVIFLKLIFSGVFVARGKEDALVTLNMVPGDSVYGEKRISVEVSL